MRIPFRHLVPAVATVVILASCDPAADTVGTTGASFLLATIEGNIQAKFEGTGDFDTGRDPERGIPIFFINSRGTGTAVGDRIIFASRGTGRLKKGSYSIGQLRGPDTPSDGLVALYLRTAENTIENYVAHSGELSVTASSKDRLEGTFRFKALRNCLPDASTGSVAADDPCTPIPGGVTDVAWVEIVGEFVAVQATYAGIIARPGP